MSKNVKGYKCHRRRGEWSKWACLSSAPWRSPGQRKRLSRWRVPSQLAETLAWSLIPSDIIAMATFIPLGPLTGCNITELTLPVTTTFFLFPIHREMKRDNNKSGNIVTSTNTDQQVRVNNKESFQVFLHWTIMICGGFIYRQRIQWKKKG